MPFRILRSSASRRMFPMHAFSGCDLLGIPPVQRFTMLQK